MREDPANTIASRKAEGAKPGRRQSFRTRAVYWLPAGFLLILVFACFARTLSSFFLADDIGEIAYVARIFHGHPGLFWANFTGNYMHVASMSVYRPWLFMTLVFDYAFWRTNAFGYYLTNLLYYSGCVVLLYLTSLKLTDSFGKWRSLLASFFGAALFALSPLHCESISWVVGRVDIASCFYYLLSFYCLLLWREKGKNEFAAGSVLFFWLGLFVKEMAIGLPALAACYGFIFPHSLNPESGTLKPESRLKSAWSISYPLWISTVIYFIVRYFALGTIFGGYTGSIGSSQLGNALSRWLDPDTVRRIFFPFSAYLFHSPNMPETALALCYLGALALIVVRLSSGQLTVKWPAFLLFWLATCLAPVYQLWGLGYNLEGSRFCYFLSMPLSLLLPWLLLAPPARKTTLLPVSNKLIPALSCLIFLSMTAVFYKTAYATNVVWLQAGKEVRLLFEKSRQLAASCPAGGKYIVLGLPQERGGAHMILNGDTYRMMLSPPFMESDPAARLITFEPFLYGSPGLLNTSRFKDCLADPSTKGAYLWGGRNKGFVPLSLKPECRTFSRPKLPEIAPSQIHCLGHALAQSKNGKLWLSNVKEGDGIQFGALEASPFDFDYLEFDLDVPVKNVPLAIRAFWNTNSPRSQNQAVCELLPSQETRRHVKVHLSGKREWYTSGNIEEIALCLPELSGATITNLQFVRLGDVVPILRVNDLSPSNTGCYELAGKALSLALINPQAKAVRLEMTRPDCFFENYESGKQAQLVAQTLVLNPGQSAVELDNKYMEKPGYYQIRACYQGPDEAYSDPITIFRPYGKTLP